LTFIRLIGVRRDYVRNSQPAFPVGGGIKNLFENLEALSTAPAGRVARAIGIELLKSCVAAQLRLAVLGQKGSEDGDRFTASNSKWNQFTE
jgi:hypothetical protein